MDNLKDTLTNIAGILGAISAAILTTQANGVSLPAWLLTIAGIFGALSIGILGYFNGKNADGSKKTPEQIATQK